MFQVISVAQKTQARNFWAGKVVAITGARGELGQALIQSFRSAGAHVVGLTHSSLPKLKADSSGPHEWQQWCCGKEEELDELLMNLDILVLNHGINPHRCEIFTGVDTALEVNALSTWRLMRRFKELCETGTSNVNQPNRTPRELWVNTSEAEVQPCGRIV